jgi:hypothetical protein
MADSTRVSEDRLDMIRNKVEAGLSWYATFQFPTPDTDEDWKWQGEALEALDQVLLAWLLVINLIGASTPRDLSQPGVLNKELAKVTYYFQCFKNAVCLENPEINTLLNRVEKALERARRILSERAKSR